MGATCCKQQPAKAVHDLRGNLARTRTDVHLNSLYTSEKVLGEGSMGSVRLVRSRQNGELYAAKMIQFQRLSDETMVAEMKNEIEMLRSMDNPHIVKLEETFLGRRQITIVMECCVGGDLYSRHPYTERESATITREVLSAINYMHRKGFVHRDIKFENIMFLNTEPSSPVKLIDFGLSKKYRNGKRMTDVVGTLYSMAPEVARGAYTEACDLWSIGVIAYMLLSESMPFDTSSEYALLRAISRADYNFNGVVWASTTKDARSFINNLLILNPTQRSTAAEAIGHRWIKEFGMDDDLEINSPEIVDQIQKFGKYSKLKRTALMVIAHKAHARELQDLRKAFMRFDKEMNGTVSLEEFHHALEETHLEDDMVEQLFNMIDMDGTGSIHYMEFLAATIEARMDIQDEDLEAAFDRLDSDDSNFITKENLRDILGTEYNQEDVKKMITLADKQGNGKIDFEEFKAYMRAELSQQLASVDEAAKRTGAVPRTEEEKDNGQS